MGQVGWEVRKRGRRVSDFRAAVESAISGRRSSQRIQGGSRVSEFKAAAREAGGQSGEEAAGAFNACRVGQVVDDENAMIPIWVNPAAD